MSDSPQFLIHKACIEWAEANHADGRLVAIGMPYYLPSAILSALRAAGYAVVPREPTTRMCEMGADELPTMTYDGTDDEAASEIYRAMVEASDA